MKKIILVKSSLREVRLSHQSELCVTSWFLVRSFPLPSFTIDSLSFIHFLLLSYRSLDIISDHSPMGMMVQIGSPVCVRINSDNSVFYMGRVIDKKSQPVAYHVNLDTVPENTQEPAVWVSKANIRLLQPPW